MFDEFGDAEIARLKKDWKQFSELRRSVRLRYQEVARLVQGELRAGTHRARFDARNLPSGVYFYRIQAGDFHSTHGMTLLK